MVKKKICLLRPGCCNPHATHRRLTSEQQQPFLPDLLLPATCRVISVSVWTVSCSCSLARSPGLIPFLHTSAGYQKYTKHNLPVNVTSVNVHRHTSKRLWCNLTTVYTSYPLLPWVMMMSEWVSHTALLLWPEESGTMISDLMFDITAWQVKDSCRPFPALHFSNLLAARQLPVLYSSQSQICVTHTNSNTQATGSA